MSEEPTPDGLLLRRYRESRDEGAFAEIQRRHGRLVLATCRRETGDPALAEDAAQAVFLLLIRKTFDEKASLAGWLHGASRLVSRNLLREEARRQRRERRAYEEFREPDDAWNAVSPHIDAALAALGEGDREAVLLRFAGDLGLAEVGRTLGVGENAARMRVNRALERMRTHLRRAGAGVSVLLLASLLTARLAEAGTPSFAAPSERARRVARASSYPKFLPLATGGAAILVVAGLGFYSVLSGPPRLSAREADRLFRAASGGWRGTLEFADDRTGVRTTTTVRVDVAYGSDGLRLVARYPRYTNVDTTTISSQGDGRYRIDNGGPGSSHRLDGLYELIRGKGGTPTFSGFSPAARGDVRLTLRTTANSLRLEENVRRGAEFRLRNRFDLTHDP